jgi:hypothetical protein
MIEQRPSGLLVVQTPEPPKPVPPEPPKPERVCAHCGAPSYQRTLPLILSQKLLHITRKDGKVVSVSQEEIIPGPFRIEVNGLKLTAKEMRVDVPIEHIDGIAECNRMDHLPPPRRQ